MTEDLLINNVRRINEQQEFKRKRYEEKYSEEDALLSYPNYVGDQTATVIRRDHWENSYAVCRVDSNGRYRGYKYVPVMTLGYRDVDRGSIVKGSSSTYRKDETEYRFLNVHRQFNYNDRPAITIEDNWPQHFDTAEEAMHIVEQYLDQRLTGDRE